MRGHYSLIGFAAAVLAAWFLGSCSENPSDVPIPNRAPVVSVSAGPIRDSVDVFIVTFNWNASDDDGQVSHFLFAFDDTMPDDWVRTEAFELQGWVLQAPTFAGIDSIFVGQAIFERYRFRGAHTFYLKAVDDDGAESAPVSVSFTAETIAPETQITIPDPGVIVELGRTFTVSWEGIDLDGTEEPVAYTYRVVPVDNVLFLGAAAIESTLFDPLSTEEQWSPLEARTSVQLTLQVPQDYIFGVLAQDQAGAIEPRLRTSTILGSTNAMRIRGREAGGQPALMVSSSVKTTSFPTADETKKTFQIPANSNVTFTWTADASRYGGRIAGYSHGIDLDDPQGDDPRWSPESATETRLVLRFDVPEGSASEEHLFYVRARDDVGTAIIADITLIVVPLSLERDVLYVDDFGESTGRVFDDCIPAPTENVSQTADFPHDQCHDQFIREAIERGLAAIGREEWIVDRYEPLEPRTGDLTRRREVFIDSTTFDYWVYGQDGGVVIGAPVTLENLARYELVIWNVRSEDTSQLYQMNQLGEDNFLAVYLESGGNVWIMGTGAFSRTRNNDRSVGLSPFGFDPEDFPYRFLQVESVQEGGECFEGCFRVSGQSTRFQRANGFEGAYLHPLAAAEGYPDVRVTREPFVQPDKGIPNCEGMVVPTGLDINPRLRLFGGRLDTLYFYQSNQKLQIFPFSNSWMDNAACALRYQGPGQGKLMMFGFPIYYLPVDEVDQLMVASLRWLSPEP
jgi:hypothetical protein